MFCIAYCLFTGIAVKLLPVNIVFDLEFASDVALLSDSQQAIQHLLKYLTIEVLRCSIRFGAAKCKVLVQYC